MRKHTNFVNSFKFILIFLPLFFLLANSCKKPEADEFDNLDILGKINSLEGLSAIEIEPQNGYSREFQIDITQPVDHNNPDGAKFKQRIYLTHVDENLPMIFAPNGYRAAARSTQELAGLLQTNCLNVTHRYFFDARPEPTNWQYCTIKQAADDDHLIVSLFKKIYSGKWISSGASKSGMTALYHKRYYPDDVDATVAYVAPFIFGSNDKRFPEYIATIGGGDCYAKLTGIQQYVLKHRSQMLGFINTALNGQEANYSIDRELLLELDIMDFPFTFWQYYSIDCSAIPDTATTSAQEIFNFYTGIVPLNSFSNDNTAYFEPFSYQAVTEMGAPAYDFAPLKGLLTKVDTLTMKNPNYELLAPQGIDYSFNYSTMTDIYAWLQNNGNKIIYIYGKNDPWTAGAIDLSGNVDALKIVQDGANHSVKIANLDSKGLVFYTLENWLGIQMPDMTKQSTISCEMDKRVYRLAN
jgi:hypothetical protein